MLSLIDLPFLGHRPPPGLFALLFLWIVFSFVLVFLLASFVSFKFVKQC